MRQSHWGMVAPYLFLQACATPEPEIRIDPKPAWNFIKPQQIDKSDEPPTDLAIYHYVKKKTARLIAFRLVRAYEDKLLRARNLESNGYGITPDAQGIANLLIIPACATIEGADYHKETIPGKNCRKAFTLAVHLASAFPDSFDELFAELADSIVDEMVRFARAQAMTPTRNGLENFEGNDIAKMFRWYAGLAERQVVYLEIAAKQDPDPEDEINVLFQDIVETTTTATRSEAMLGDELRLTHALPFNEAGIRTWKFGMRRREVGGDDLPKQIIRLTKAAIKKANEKAESFENQVDLSLR